VRRVLAVPIEVSHYYLGHRRPFLNLSDLTEARRNDVMRELIALRRAGRQARPFGARYAQWRDLTERRLRELFIQRGGTPRRQSPHYFVLGGSSWFAGLAEDMQTLTLPLSALPAAATSFTLLDSFAAMGFAGRFGYPDDAKSHERQVYLLHELDETVAAYGLPPGTDERYIEVQLWDDEPVRGWVG
jgi:hypothetical protein